MCYMYSLQTAISLKDKIIKHLSGILDGAAAERKILSLMHVWDLHTSQQVCAEACAVVSNTPCFGTSFLYLLMSPKAVYLAVSCFALHHKPPTVKT